MSFLLLGILQGASSKPQTQTHQACLFPITLELAELLLFFRSFTVSQAISLRKKGRTSHFTFNCTRWQRVKLKMEWKREEVGFILPFIFPVLLFILLLQEARRTEKPIYFFHFSWYDLSPRDSSTLYYHNSQALLPLSFPFPLFLNYCVW